VKRQPFRAQPDRCRQEDLRQAKPLLARTLMVINQGRCPVLSSIMTRRRPLPGSPVLIEGQHSFLGSPEAVMNVRGGRNAERAEVMRIKHGADVPPGHMALPVDLAHLTHTVPFRDGSSLPGRG